MSHDLCARLGCTRERAAHRRGTRPLYCSKDCSTAAKHARDRRQSDPNQSAFMLALVDAAREHLTGQTAEALAAHHGRSADELRTMLAELCEEDFLIATPHGWSQHPSAAGLPRIPRRRRKGGRRSRPLVAKPGRDPARSAAAPSPATDVPMELRALPSATDAGGPSPTPDAAVRGGCAAGAPPSQAKGAAIACPCDERVTPPRASNEESPRVLGDKIDGGTTLVLPVPERPPLAKQFAPGTSVTIEGESFDVVSRGPAGVGLVHREAAIYLFGRSVHLEADKRGLRELTERGWLVRWLELATRIVIGAPCPSLDEAARFGWQCGAVELALDVVGFAPPHDVQNFSTVTKDRHGRLHVAEDGRPSWVCPTRNPRPRDALGLTIQDKSQWARSRKGGGLDDLLDHPAEGPLLGAQGLLRGERVTRIEAHVAGRALSMSTKKTGEVLYDLRSPGALLDPVERSRLWAFALAKVRYVHGGDGPAAQRGTRAEWLGITQQAAAPNGPRPAALARAARTARERSLAAEERNLVAQAERVAQRLAVVRAAAGEPPSRA